jgi:hypothetical protein
MTIFWRTSTTFGIPSLFTVEKAINGTSYATTKEAFHDQTAGNRKIS